MYFLDLFGDGNDLSWDQIQSARNTYYQKQMANQISLQTTETLSLLTSALNIHLNIDQYLQMSTSSVFMSLETIGIQSLSNRNIKQSGNAHIQIPSNFQLNSIDNSSITVRVSLFHFCGMLYFIYLVNGPTTCFIW
jgi:hypothetical protein